MNEMQKCWLLFMIPPFVFVVACGTAYWLSIVLCQFPWSGTSYDISKFVCNQNCLWEQKRLNVLLLNPRLRTKAGGKGISGRCHNKVKVEAVSQNRLCTENLNLFWTSQSEFSDYLSDKRNWLKINYSVAFAGCPMNFHELESLFGFVHTASWVR